MLKANWVTWAWLSTCVSIVVAFFVFLFASVNNFVVTGWWMKPAIVLFVGFFAIMSWFTGGYVAAATAEAGQKAVLGHYQKRHPESER